MDQILPPCENGKGDLYLTTIMNKLKELKIPYVSKVTTNKFDPALTDILVTNTNPTEAPFKYVDTEDLSDDELCVYLQHPCLREQVGGKSVLQMISDLQSQTITDPCHPEKTTKKFIDVTSEDRCNGVELDFFSEL